MKIAFVTPAYYPAIIGASLYSTELAENLVKRGHDVKVFTPRIGNVKQRETVRGIEVVRPEIRQLTESYYVSGDMIKEISKEKFDVIHSHHYGYFPATAGFIAAKRTGTPHVFGPYYHPPVYGVKRMAMFAAYHMTQGLPILRLSQAVLPHTRYEKKMLTSVGGDESNMSLLPNIVNTRDFPPVKKKGRIVLFASNFIYEKGAHIAFDIAEQLISERDDVRFVFIGNPHEPKLIDRMNRLSKNKRVKFLKGLSKKDLIKQYQEASIVLLPSKYEAFSRVLAEAESCGCAIVATRVGGIPEVVRDGKSGFLFEHGDWAGMKEKINYLLDNPKNARKMGLAGSKYVKENFDTVKVVDTLEKIYWDVV